MTIGERIQKARKYRGLTLQALAERVGVTKSAVHRVENGDSGAPSVANLFKYARALGVNAAWLGTGDGTMIESPDSLSALSDREAEIIEIFRALGDVDQAKLWGIVYGFSLREKAKEPAPGETPNQTYQL